MGASNALMVSANWKHLGHREHRLLTYMALISLDADTPPVYFGGWQAVVPSSVVYDQPVGRGVRM